MFRILYKLVFLAVLAAGWVLATACLHVVWTKGDHAWGTVTVITKDQMTFTDTVVDARNWQPSDFESHPALARRLLEGDRINALKSLNDAAEAHVRALEKAAGEKLQAEAAKRGNAFFDQAAAPTSQPARKASIFDESSGG